MLLSILLFSHQVTTSYWPLLPFGILLTLIAIGPLLFKTFWHESYRQICVALGAVVAVWFFIVFKQPAVVLEFFFEYLSFITLLFALYAASGGIYLFIDQESKVSINLVFLITGALMANLIGTTGASILLIRPYLRLNRYRLKPYHLVFYIFMISNCGGLLTPIGDPPLFIGYLKGIPFLYFLKHLWLVWLVCMTMLSVIFYILEKQNHKLDDVDVPEHFSGKIFIQGKRNFIWLLVILGCLFLDPRLITSLPVITIYGHQYSFVREILLLVSAILCLRYCNTKAMESNRFSYGPIQEVAYIFFGLFLTMIPAIGILEQIGSTGLNLSAPSTYFLTGITSAFLDNAPSFLNMLTLSMASHGLSVQVPESVLQFAQGDQGIYVLIISTASVFWGGMSYIGNGPNLMIRSIAQHEGVNMPGFFAYIIRYAIPYLLPCLLIALLLLM